MYNSALSEKSQRNGVTVCEQETLRRSGVIYRAAGNILIVRETQKAVPHNFANTVRGAINCFSPGAAIRMRRYLRECLADYKQMVTLTYPCDFPTNGGECKEHLRRFLQEVQRQHNRKYKGAKGEHSSFWFLEFQERGAPHFHIFATWLPDKRWCSLRWYEIVGSEDKRHLQAGTRVEFLHAGRAGTISYASKYAAKLEQKVVPEGFEKVGRFWGVYGRRGTVAADAFVSRCARDILNSKQAINSFYRAINNMIFNGLAEVIIRDKGVLVMNIHNLKDQKRMRALVSVISCSVMRYDSMFYDAELDIGESYHAESIDRTA